MYMTAPEDQTRAPASPDPTAEKSTSRSSATRSLILGVACQAFASKGFTATTTGDIAALAGLPKANVHYYFGTKKNLYKQVLEVVAEPYLNALTLLCEGNEPQSALSAYIRSKVRIAQTLPSASSILASELMHGARRLSQAYVDQVHAQIQRCISRLQYWMDQGLLAPVDPRHLLLTISAATQTYVSFGRQISVITGKHSADEADYACAAATLVQLVLRGTAPERHSINTRLPSPISEAP
jgi:TetR/AcrR family transcriptional regulator